MPLTNDRSDESSSLSSLDSSSSKGSYSLNIGPKIDSVGKSEYSKDSRSESFDRFPSPKKSPIQPVKAYLSISSYVKKAGIFKTVNSYYSNIISTHPSVSKSYNGEEEAVDEFGDQMVDAVQKGDLASLEILCSQIQKERGVGACIVGERLGSLLLHLAAENGHAHLVSYLIDDLWVDCDTCTIRGMTAAHYASKANRVSVIRQLSLAGADFSILNDAGQVPGQMTNNRIMQRIFDHLLIGKKGGRCMRDYRLPIQNEFDSTIMDYILVLNVAIHPQLTIEGEIMKQGVPKIESVQIIPKNEKSGMPLPDFDALAHFVLADYSCKERDNDSLFTYTTILTDSRGARSYATCCNVGIYEHKETTRKLNIASSLCAPRQSDETEEDESKLKVGQAVCSVVGMNHGLFYLENSLKSVHHFAKVEN